MHHMGTCMRTPQASREDEEDVGAANISNMFSSDTSTAIVPVGKANGVTTRRYMCGEEGVSYGWCKQAP